MYECTERDAIHWAAHTMINVYPDWVDRDLNLVKGIKFKEIALIRLKALRQWLINNDLPIMADQCQNSINEINNIKDVN